MTLMRLIFHLNNDQRLFSVWSPAGRVLDEEERRRTGARMISDILAEPFVSVETAGDRCYVQTSHIIYIQVQWDDD